MQKTLDQFTGIYKLSKTLRFELKPVAETKETFHKAGLLDRDRKRAQNYTRVKEILDEQHKYLLERSLSQIKNTISSLDDKIRKQVHEVLNALGSDFDWELLGKAIQEYRISGKDKKAKDKLEKVQKSFRTALLVLIRQDEWFESLVKDSTPSKYFKGMIEMAKKKGEEPDESIESFARFACYFKGYQENRKNIYSDDAQKTAAPNRIVNDNFSRFLEAARIFGVMQTRYPKIVRNIESELTVLLKGKRLEDIFSLSSFSDFLSQTGIDRLNTIIGGSTRASGGKIRGVNEFINLYRQQNEDARADRQLTTMPILYKQILSDRISSSFIPAKFENDQEVFEAVSHFQVDLDPFELNGQKLDVLKKLKELLASVSAQSEIYVDAAELSFISQKFCGSWGIIASAQSDFAESRYKKKSDQEKYLKRDQY